MAAGCASRTGAAAFDSWEKKEIVENISRITPGLKLEDEAHEALEWPSLPLRTSRTWSMKALVKQMLRSRGLIVKKLPVDNIEETLRQLFTAVDINCVIDAGAHFGEYGRWLREIGYTGRIISFEPVRASYERLRESAKGDASWMTNNLALGRGNASLEINVPDYSVFASFLDATKYCNEQFGEESTAGAKETVKVVTLDSMFAQCVSGLGVPRVYLKLDTQGYDLEVIGGASASLPSIRALQSEVSVKPIYEGMPNWVDAIGVYKSLGYEVTGLYPVNRDKNMSVIEFDCVMRRSDSAN
jgi:FkbM family methyltransferase